MLLYLRLKLGNRLLQFLVFRCETLVLLFQSLQPVRRGLNLATHKSTAAKAPCDVSHQPTRSASENGWV